MGGELCCINLKSRTFARLAGTVVAVAAGAMFVVSATAQNKEPIKIGFSMALTGPLAANGKQALLGMKIWEEETNAKGGLLGRPVKLVYYDDQSNPSTVPGIYTKLLDVDKVDLVVGGYATNMVAPAMPVVMQKKKTFISLFALDVNHEFKYPKYFSVLPTGPKTKPSFTEGLFQVAHAAESEADDGRVGGRGRGILAERLRGRARERQDLRHQDRLRQKLPARHDRLLADRARAAGVECGHRDRVLLSAQLGRHGARRSTSSTTSRRSSAARWSACRPPCSRASSEPKLNGIVNYETWVPSDKMMAPAAEFFKKYQARAGAEGVDPLGYYLGGWGYAYINMLGEADRRRPRASRTTRSPSGCAKARTRPSWATGATARAANGPSPA